MKMNKMLALASVFCYDKKKKKKVFKGRGVILTAVT